LILTGSRSRTSPSRRLLYCSMRVHSPLHTISTESHCSRLRSLPTHETVGQSPPSHRSIDQFSSSLPVQSTRHVHRHLDGCAACPSLYAVAEERERERERHHAHAPVEREDAGGCQQCQPVRSAAAPPFLLSCRPPRPSPASASHTATAIPPSGSAPLSGCGM
jgi:hypothetical protein